MKNKLNDLQNHIFEMIEDVKDMIDDENLTDEKLERKVKIHTIFNELARTAVSNGALMAKCVDLIYGIPVSDEVPLIPKAEGETFLVDKKRKALLSVPRDDGAGGYKRNKQNPV